MSYIVIETFGGAEYAIIVTDEDGKNMIFDDKADAEEEAGNCQDAIIVEL
jgi:hypothetical protein